VGALLDALVEGLQQIATIQLRANRAWPILHAGPWPARRRFCRIGTFLSTYLGNRLEALAETVANNPVAASLRVLMNDLPLWKGASTELLVVLNGLVAEPVAKSKPWPRSASALSRYLGQVAPSLRAAGISISFRREGGSSGARMIHITKANEG